MHKVKMSLCVYVRLKENPSVWNHSEPKWVRCANMAGVSSKNKLKMGSAGRYYGAYLIYDVANSCLASLHAKIPPVPVTRTSPPSPVHVQNPRKSILYLLLSSSLFPSSRLTLLSDLSWFSPSTWRGFSHKCGKNSYLYVTISIHVSQTFHNIELELKILVVLELEFWYDLNILLLKFLSYSYQSSKIDRCEEN